MDVLTKDELYYTLKDYLKKLTYELSINLKTLRDYKTWTNDRLLDFIEGIVWSYEAIIITKNIHNSSLINYNFQKTLENLVYAYKNNDIVYVTDIIIYEVYDEIMIWQKVII